jgi:hypothetical protein
MSDTAQPGFLNLFVNKRNIDGGICMLLVASYGAGLRDLITITVESDGLIKLEQHHWGPPFFHRSGLPITEFVNRVDY